MSSLTTMMYFCTLPTFCCLLLMNILLWAVNNSSWCGYLVSALSCFIWFFFAVCILHLWYFTTFFFTIIPWQGTCIYHCLFLVSYIFFKQWALFCPKVVLLVCSLGYHAVIFMVISCCSGWGRVCPWGVPAMWNRCRTYCGVPNGVFCHTFFANFLTHLSH